MPPLTSRFVPVMNAAASEARNTAASAASSGAPAAQRGGAGNGRAYFRLGEFIVEAGGDHAAAQCVHPDTLRPQLLAMARVKVITAALAVA